MTDLAKAHRELLELRNHMHQSTVNELEYLYRRLQLLIDIMQPMRQSSPGHIKYKLSYISKKIDLAGKAIGMALDKIDE